MCYVLGVKSSVFTRELLFYLGFGMIVGSQDERQKKYK